MKIKIAMLVMMLFLNIGFANLIEDELIKLPDHFKVENTFSGDLPDNKSFHLIFAKNKNTKRFEIFSYLYDGDKVIEMGVIKNKHSYSLVSFHSNGNMLSLLLNYKIKKENFIRKIELNIESKEISESKAFGHKDFETSFRKVDRSILIYKSKTDLLIRQFKGSEEAQEKNINISIEGTSIKRYFKDQYISSINTDEFVDNGSTLKLKVYLIEDDLVFTKEDQKGNQTSVLIFSLNNDNDPFRNSFSNTNAIKFKKSTSYVFDNKLYQLAISKDKGTIKVWDIYTNRVLSEIALQESLGKYVKSKENFKGITDYLKQAAKKKYIPTIAVNKTIAGIGLVRIDYVDITYSYNYNWWWHHHQFMMWQQQQMHFQNNMMNSVPNFGPSLSNNYILDLYKFESDDRYFELLIDGKGSIANNDNTETVYSDLNKEEYIDKLEDIDDFKYESSCFLKDSFRFIAYSKVRKGFVFQTNELK